MERQAKNMGLMVLWYSWVHRTQGSTVYRQQSHRFDVGGMWEEVYGLDEMGVKAPF